MRRGEIYLVNLDPSKSGEANKQRPAVIVSNDAANVTAERNSAGVITVVPITSSTSKVYPFQVFLPSQLTGLDMDLKAQAEQVRSISIERLNRPIGRLTHDLMLAVDEALRLHLAL
jgi:mRNA interferase MazF